METNRTWALLLLGAVCAWGQADISEEVAVCCPGGFTRERAVTAARSWAARERGQIKLLRLTDDPGDLGAYGRSSETSAETADAEYRVNWLRPRRLALFLQTSKGSAIDFWDGGSRTFERKLLSGGNPFWVGETAEILLVHHNRGTAEFWCRTSDGDDASVGRTLIGRLAALVKGAAVRVNWADNPWFLDDPNYRFFPSLGWAGLPSRYRTRVQNTCVMDANGKDARCP